MSKDDKRVGIAGGIIAIATLGSATYLGSEGVIGGDAVTAVYGLVAGLAGGSVANRIGNGK